MSAQVVDWLTQGVTLVLVIYFGLHLRSQLRTLKSTVETQKVTIEAQAESMKAQSAVLQDFERHSKIMQQVIDFFDPQAQLQREQAYKERFEREMKSWEEAISNAHHIMIKATSRLRKTLTIIREQRIMLDEKDRLMDELLGLVRENRKLWEERLELRAREQKALIEASTRACGATDPLERSSAV